LMNSEENKSKYPWILKEHIDLMLVCDKCNQTYWDDRPMKPQCPGCGHVLYSNKYGDGNQNTN